MASPVYFIDLRATTAENFLAKLARLLSEAGLADTVKRRDLVAVKLHFGEAGNTAFIRPVYIRQIIQSVKALQGVPFLTDANTLYAGTRGDTPHHLTTAIQNGFDYAVVDAPLVKVKPPCKSTSSILTRFTSGTILLRRMRWCPWRTSRATNFRYLAVRLKTSVWGALLGGVNWRSIQPFRHRSSRSSVSVAANAWRIVPIRPWPWLRSALRSIPRRVWGVGSVS